jgi:hypothetical protein
MKTERNGWLARQIDSAKKSLEERPDWMKRTAHFEGGNNTSPAGSTENQCLTDVVERKESPGSAKK